MKISFFPRCPGRHVSLSTTTRSESRLWILETGERYEGEERVIEKKSESDV